MSQLKALSPQRAAALMNDGAILVDIRNADEYARENIPGARHHELHRIDQMDLIDSGDDVVIFHCKSGTRTRMNGLKLAGAVSACEAYHLEGGIEAWKKAGLPVRLDRRQPIEIMRQVQIVAGALVLIGALMGFLVHAAFYGLSAFVGAGLVFAGASGFCTMAKLLALMPWNRRAPA